MKTQGLEISQYLGRYRRSKQWRSRIAAVDMIGQRSLQNLRGVLLGSQTSMEMHIFTGLVGIQMLAHEHARTAAAGDATAPDQLTMLFRQVQTTKAAKAQELFAKRSQNKER
jgi:hypothetical protein